MAKKRAKRATAPEKEDAIRIGVEGENISPKSFDVVATLAFVNAFVATMRAAAEVENHELGLHSLVVRKGSAAFEMQAQNQPLADALLARTHCYLVGKSEPPRGTRGKVVELRQALEGLPSGHQPFVEAKKKRNVLPTSFADDEIHVEITTVRGIVVRAGGFNPARIHIRMDDDTTINPRAPRNLVEKAGKNLYSWVDAVLTLERRGDKVLESSAVHDFDVIQEMSADDEIRRWKDWFSKVGGDWDDVEDIELELEREHSRR